MYQFTTTTVLNSNLDSSGKTKFVGTSAGLNVLRVLNFKKDNIVSIHERPYAAGVKEVAQVTIPVIAAGLVARVTVDIRLSQQTDSEYANTYLYFKKPVTVEVIATGTAATDATALKNQINGLKDRYGVSYVVATTSGADLIITATTNNQKIFSILVEKEKASTNSIIQPEYENVTASFSVTTPGKVGFGDDEFMVRKIMIPTADNTRYFGTNKEERPVIGGNYSQYTIRYKVEKDGMDGIVAGGFSVTTHVFYVKSDLVSAFDTAIGNMGLTTTGAFNILATGGVVSLSTAGDETVQLLAYNMVGKVTYTSDQPTRATVGASTGLVTTAGVTATGAVVITATDSVGNTDTIAITVTT